MSALLNFKSLTREDITRAVEEVCLKSVRLGVNPPHSDTEEVRNKYLNLIKGQSWTNEITPDQDGQQNLARVFTIFENNLWDYFYMPLSKKEPVLAGAFKEEAKVLFSGSLTYYSLLINIRDVYGRSIAYFDSAHEIIDEGVVMLHVLSGGSVDEETTYRYLFSKKAFENAMRKIGNPNYRDGDDFPPSYILYLIGEHLGKSYASGQPLEVEMHRVSKLPNSNSWELVVTTKPGNRRNSKKKVYSTVVVGLDNNTGLIKVAD